MLCCCVGIPICRGAEGLLGSMVYNKRRAVSTGLKAMVTAELPMNVVSPYCSQPIHQMQRAANSAGCGIKTYSWLEQLRYDLSKRARVSASALCM